MKLFVQSLILIALIFSAGSTFAQREPIDQIVVVVGDQVILASELNSQVQLFAFQSGKQPRTEEELVALQKQILDQMITEQLFLFEARQDTTISVRPSEVERALDEHVARIASNFESDQEFLDALAAEGMSIRELRKKYRNDAENQLLRQRFIQRKLYSVSVSRREVERFFAEYKDSIPSQPEGAKLSHLMLAYEASPEVEDSVRARAAELRQMVLDGSDFATLATRFSSAGAGTMGGDLGFVNREDVVPEFARAAFNLSVGDISGIIRTPFGFHVIKCEGTQGDKLHLRHILLSVEPSKADSARLTERVDSLLQAAREGAEFAEMAKEYSADSDTRAKGGELGWFAIDQLPTEFIEVVAGWKTPGEYRGPVQSRHGVHIVKLLDYQAEKQFDLKEDFDRIKELARQDKTGKLVDKWIEEIRARTFVEHRI